MPKLDRHQIASDNKAEAQATRHRHPRGHRASPDYRTLGLKCMLPQMRRSILSQALPANTTIPDPLDHNHSQPHRYQHLTRILYLGPTSRTILLSSPLPQTPFPLTLLSAFSTLKPQNRCKKALLKYVKSLPSMFMVKALLSARLSVWITPVQSLYAAK